jgi:hypothetical protein
METEKDRITLPYDEREMIQFEKLSEVFMQ